MIEYSYIIAFLPLLSYALIVFFFSKSNKMASGVAITAVLTSFVLSTIVLFEVLADHGPHIFEYEWISMPGLELPLSIYIDPLAAVMLMVVTIVSSCVHIYSIGYMHGDPRFPRFFSFLSLFTFSMLGLVISGTFFATFIFWELVGLTSYLLIGFWFEKKVAADAGKKAFITTKIGDLGFLAGLLILYAAAGTLNYEDIYHLIEHHQIPVIILSAAGILLFCGAVGKSAQFPLHVWLPDAMEGPTPVSALIHAATMVAAGVYLTARIMSIIVVSESAAITIAYIGGFTALMAASIGLVQNDIKRVLAYSTVSQLGYMILALGCGGYTAGTFHLMTHAFFKALLFLGAGSVIHAAHTNDIQEMGGLAKKMPITSKTFFIASLSIAGIFPLSGFWSKDEIFLSILEEGHIGLLILAIVVAGMTAFYMFRLCFLTFTGEPRNKEKYEHAHESPNTMTYPLIFLAILAVCAGWVGIPWLHHGYASFVYHHHPHHPHPNYMLMLIGTIVAVGGIYLAYLMYYKRSIDPVAMGARFKGIYTFLFNKWWFDELYMGTVIRFVYWFMEVLYRFDQGVIDWFVNFVGRFGLFNARFWQTFDVYVIDGAVNGAGIVTRWFAGGLRKIQTGAVQNYAFVVFLGVVLFILFRFM
ncbi:MAG: NADH-quinone oxidoreductase subunit L [candidate division Zixibacteria bacterium]|nr:NADH-quinone oxidoreductase subunit L [candidate division Zixibacteria bacterium]